MIGRFVVLQTIGLLLIATGWYTGIVPMLLEADRVYAIPVLCVLLIVGLWCVAARRIEEGLWIASKLPVVSLVFTVFGLITAVMHAQGMDIDAARMQVFTDVSFSLVANMVGMAGMFWLELVQKVCHEKPIHR